MAARRAITTTQQFFQELAAPRSIYRGSYSGRFSELPLVRKAYFQGYEVKEWVGFNQQAAGVLTGESQRQVTQDFVGMWARFWNRNQSASLDESSLSNCMDRNLLEPVRDIKQEFGLSTGEWGPNGRGTTNFSGRESPDYVFRVGRDAQVAMEMKRHNLDLSTWDAETLTENLSKSLDQIHENNPLHPFLQVFSYMLQTSKGIGVLSTYDQTVFFRLDLGRKRIEMSPLVKVDQKLREGERPNAVQTLIFVMMEEAGRKISNSAKEKVIEKAKRSADKLQKKLDEDRQKRAGKSSSKGKGKQASYKVGSSGKYGSVTDIMHECTFVRELGEGVTGFVEEHMFRDIRVAIKKGYQYNRRYSKIDGFEHVSNEVEIYERLKPLYGRVVPHVYAWGVDWVYTPGAMVLIMEVVGGDVVEEHGKAFVNGELMSRKDLEEIGERALVGLEELCALGIVHFDKNINNMGVRRLDGDWDVRWIDFGDAADYEVELVEQARRQKEMFVEKWNKFIESVAC